MRSYMKKRNRNVSDIHIPSQNLAVVVFFFPVQTPKLCFLSLSSASEGLRAQITSVTDNTRHSYQQ